jgi:RNA polymerase sigma factor (sigma-70 family)
LVESAVVQPEDEASIDPAKTADLIERAKHGDREAADILFARHIPLLKRWASGRLPHWARDLADTGDLVQATALGAFRSLNTFEVRGDGALQAYLRQALMNRLRNELRRVSRKPVPELLDTGLADDAPSPLEAAIDREHWEKYTAALDQLPADDREAIIGRLEFGLSYAELAELLGKSTPEAARKMVSRALVKLAEQMP